ncbi:MAG: SRPBCC family protein [Janthinobacterium lividum]
MVKLCSETLIAAPLERCFDLARSVDVHTVGASPIHGKAIAGRMAGLSTQGDWTTWSARFFSLRFSLTTAITDFNPLCGFSDALRGGLFTEFGHVYHFAAKGVGQTMMTDEFSFQSPFGFLGAFFDSVLLRPRMQATMDFRAVTIKRIAESDEWLTYLSMASH